MSSIRRRSLTKAINGRSSTTRSWSSRDGDTVSALISRPLPLRERATQDDQQAQLGEGSQLTPHPIVLLKCGGALSRRGRGRNNSRGDSELCRCGTPSVAYVTTETPAQHS